jgi:alanyl-tRNA synthetase
LDRTVFFPEGGGQPSDKGLITIEIRDHKGGAHKETIQVFYVFENNDVVYHQIEPMVPGDGALDIDRLSDLIGSSVYCQLNWEQRFSHMQRHCGEHILSAVFYDLYGGVNRGFHMGDDYMTIDISLEENPDFETITEDMMLKVEIESNKMIWDNLPVTTRYFKHKSDALDLPMRKNLTIEENIILVCVGDEGKASGCVACCGTHPAHTGEVGLIKLYRWENYKGMTRITFDAGYNAYKNMRAEADIVKDLSLRYSSDDKNLLEKINHKEQKNSETRQELYQIKQAYLKEKALSLTEDLSISGKVVFSRYDILKAEDLLAMSKLLPDLKGKLLALTSLTEKTIILLSDGNPDCNKIVKDNAIVWRGKGGGRANNARAMFPTIEDLDCFLDYIQKAY